MSHTGQPGPRRRQVALAALQDRHFGLLVVVGGVTGCGVAVDTAARGLPVALLEAYDCGVGAPSRFSKLIRGGLRHLEQRGFALVRGTLHECRLLLGAQASHLVRPVEFLFPLTRRIREQFRRPRPPDDSGCTERSHHS